MKDRVPLVYLADLTHVGRMVAAKATAFSVLQKELRETVFALVRKDLAARGLLDPVVDVYLTEICRYMAQVELIKAARLQYGGDMIDGLRRILMRTTTRELFREAVSI